MTQAVAVTTTAPPGGAAPPLQEGISPSVIPESAPFAQLLMLVQQGVDVGVGESMPTVPAEVAPSPEQKTLPTATEAEQMMALLGLPILPFSAFPAPETQPVQPNTSELSSGLPMQVVTLPGAASDGMAIASEQVLLRQTPQGANEPEGFTLPEPNRPQAIPAPGHGGDPSSKADVPQPSPAPLDVSILTPQMPSVPETEAVLTATPPAQKSHANGESTSGPSSGGIAIVQNAENVPPRLEQISGAGQFRAGTEHEQRRDAEPAQGTSRPAGRKARFVPVEHLSTTRLTPTAQQGLHGVAFTPALQRASAHAATPAADVAPPQVVRQVVAQIEAMTHQRNADSVTLQLEPEHLGRLRVTISVSDGTIHTHIVADNHAVRQMLESNSALLQQALQERGLHLGALQVSVQGDGRQFALHQPYTPQHSAGGWAEAGTATVSEANFGYTTAGGINLLV